MRSIVAIGILCFTFLIISCKKEYIGSYDPEYVGLWHSDTLTIPNSGQRGITYVLIDGSKSEYGYLCPINCSSCNCNQHTIGKATINKSHNKLAIGNNEKKTLTIDSAPVKNTKGIWECSLNKVVMYRQ